MSALSLWATSELTVAPSVQAAGVWEGVGGGQAGREEGGGSPPEGRCGPPHCTLGASESLAATLPVSSSWGGAPEGPRAFGSKKLQLGSWDRTEQRLPPVLLLYFFTASPLSPRNACAAPGHFMCPKDGESLLASLFSPCSPTHPPSQFTRDACVTSLHGWPSDTAPQRPPMPTPLYQSGLQQAQG